MPVTLSEAGGLSGSGTTNYIPKWTPDGFTLGNSIMQDNGSGVGVNSTPLANTMFGAKGIDSTSSNFAGKFVASDDSEIVVFRNDKRVGINTGSPTSTLDVRGQTISGNGSGNVTNNDSPFYASRPSTGAPNYHSGWQYVFEVGGGIWGVGMNYSTNQFQFLTNGASTAKFVFGDGNPSAPNAKFIMDLNGGFFGIGTTTPTSKLQVVGLPTYANNAAAIAGGLTAGALYIRGAHGLDIVV